MVGSFCPAGAAGGSVRKPSTAVPSLLFALKRSTGASLMPLRKSSLTCVRRRSAALDHRDSGGGAAGSRAPRSARPWPPRRPGRRAPPPPPARRPARDRDAREVRVAAVLEQEEKRLAVGREARRETLRSRVAVRAPRRRLDGTTATWFGPYQMSFGSPPARRRPTCRPGSRPGCVVAGAGRTRAASRPRGAHDEDVGVVRWSASRERLLTKAMRSPSGDQAGRSSS